MYPQYCMPATAMAMQQLSISVGETRHAAAGRLALRTCCHGRRNQRIRPSRMRATRGHRGPGPRAMVRHCIVLPSPPDPSLPVAHIGDRQKSSRQAGLLHLALLHLVLLSDLVACTNNSTALTCVRCLGGWTRLHQPGPSLAAVMGEEGAPIPTGIGDKDALEDGPWTEGPGEPREPIFEDGGALLLVVVESSSQRKNRIERSEALTRSSTNKESQFTIRLGQQALCRASSHFTRLHAGACLCQTMLR